MRARGVDEALAELAEINEGGYRNNDLLAKVRRIVLRWVAAIAEKFGFHDVATRFRRVAHDEARTARAEMIELDGKHAVPQTPDEQKQTDRQYRKYKKAD